MTRQRKSKRPRLKKIRGWKNRLRSAVKVSLITADGFWLHLPKKDYHVSRNDYPWFRDASHREIQDVKLFPREWEDGPDDFYDHGDHLRWESLDIDLGTNSFEYPERFPARCILVRGVPRPDLFDKSDEMTNMIVESTLTKVAPFGSYSTEELIARIAKVRNELGDRLLIAAHFYQKPEILALADCVGDSLQLATTVAKNEKARVIAFCGVHFMAETADMLANSAEKLASRSGHWVDVLLPDSQAGCSMADMATDEQLERCWSELKEVIDVDRLIPITYVNSTAAVKAFCGRHSGLVCTSTNATAILKKGLESGDRILFLPDEHLGRNTALSMGIPKEKMIVWHHDNPILFSELKLLGHSLPQKVNQLGGNSREVVEQSQIILWHGFCSVHQRFTRNDVGRVRAEYPGIKVVVHPECSHEVVAVSDLSGSTAMILDEIARSSPGSCWAVGTEWRMVERLIRDFPDKKIINLSAEPQLCPTMNRINLSNLCWTLESYRQGNRDSVIRVADPIKQDALLALARMF